MAALRRECEEAFRDNSGGVHRASDAEALVLESLEDLGFACEVLTPLVTTSLRPPRKKKE